MIRQRPANPLILHDRDQSGSMQVGAFWSVIWSTLWVARECLTLTTPDPFLEIVNDGGIGGGYGPWHPMGIVVLGLCQRGVL
jgi:hypothetical protein